MPELPEVQTVVSDLQEKIVNKTIEKVEIYFDKIIDFPDKKTFISELKNRKVIQVKRIAKFIVILLDNQKFLIFHLRMSGQLIFQAKTIDKKYQHIRLKIIFQDKTILIFNEMRKFGRAYLLNSKELNNKITLRYGPDPLEISSEDFLKIFLNKKGKIKALLLRQDLISGLGNIYVDESLFASKIHPETLLQNLPKGKLVRLFSNIQTILKQAISLRGTSMRDYLDITGNAGRYKEILKVYGQEGKICKNCGKNKIIKIRVAGRGTHVCLKCQRI